MVDKKSLPNLGFRRKDFTVNDNSIVHFIINNFKAVSNKETWGSQIKPNWTTDQTKFKFIVFKLLS